MKGLEGIRIFQAYALVGIAAAVVTARTRDVGNVLAVALGIGRRRIALRRGARRGRPCRRPRSSSSAKAVSTISYGGALRAVGVVLEARSAWSSFANALACSCLLAVANRRSPRLRASLGQMAALALVGVLGSYGRAPLLGIVVGLLFALVILVASGRALRAAARWRRSRWSPEPKLRVTLGGVYAASRGDARLQERAQGVVDPRADESVQLRFDTWD